SNKTVKMVTQSNTSVLSHNLVLSTNRYLIMVLVELGCKAHNKAFKWDLARVAFLACSLFSG
ncbi:hypothetical protein M2G67_22150, partial [Vibrio vulnificus]|nr:hypothetical protein [Vibrio vulnificus]MCU8483624.1 hypothetical protein [Vibrio vulnificus]